MESLKNYNVILIKCTLNVNTKTCVIYFGAIQKLINNLSSDEKLMVDGNVLIINEFYTCVGLAVEAHLPGISLFIFHVKPM